MTTGDKQAKKNRPFADNATEINTELLAKCDDPEVRDSNIALCLQHGLQYEGNEYHYRVYQRFVSQGIIKLITDAGITQATNGEPYTQSCPKGFLQHPEMWLVGKGYWASGWPSGLPQGSISLWPLGVLYSVSAMLLKGTICILPLRYGMTKRNSPQTQQRLSAAVLAGPRAAHSSKARVERKDAHSKLDEKRVTPRDATQEHGAPPHVRKAPPRSPQSSSQSSASSASSDGSTSSGESEASEESVPSAAASAKPPRLEQRPTKRARRTPKSAAPAARPPKDATRSRKASRMPAPALEPPRAADGCLFPLPSGVDLADPSSYASMFSGLL